MLRDPAAAKAEGLTAPEVPLLDAAIAKGALPADTTLYRGLTQMPGADPGAPEALRPLLTPGATFTDQGFIATSTKHPAGSMFANYHHVIIAAPAGTHGVKVPGPYSEWLLARGTTFHVDRVEQTRELYGNPLYDIYVSVQP